MQRPKKNEYRLLYRWVVPPGSNSSRICQRKFVSWSPYLFLSANHDISNLPAQDANSHLSAQRVSLPGFKNKNAPPPDHPPPPGYVCYRCGKKGHWIQACPTNDNPDFENKPRIKRATGIPKSFLQKVAAPTGQKQDGLTDDSREPTSVMVDADGNHVVAVPDMAAWQQYQEKAKAAAANKEVVSQGSKELQERGLECSIDKRLFVDPVKTPCCKMTYCNECIDNALSDHDLVCPNCSTENVLIDELQPDDEMNAKIKAYLDEKDGKKGGSRCCQVILLQKCNRRSVSWCNCGSPIV